MRGRELGLWEVVIGYFSPSKPGGGAETQPCQVASKAQCTNTHALIYKVHLFEHLLVFSPDKGK